MIKAWTYATAPKRGWYWKSGPYNESIILVDTVDGISRFHKVVDGSTECFQPIDVDAEVFRRLPLPREHWPEWLLEMDDDIDIGL